MKSINTDLFSLSLDNGIKSTTKIEPTLAMIEPTKATIEPIVNVQLPEKNNTEMEEFLKWKAIQENSKPAYKSKISMTGYGLLATGASLLLAKLGFNVPADTLVTIASTVMGVAGVALPYWRKFSTSKAIR